MQRIVINEAAFVNGPTPLEEACWMAREILGGYMDIGIMPDDEGDELQPRRVDEDGDEIPTIIHETPSILINPWQRVSLSNQPLLAGADGFSFPVTEPGYVALIIEPIDNEDMNHQAEFDTKSDQRIFRQPNPVNGEDAAIFRGFSLDEQNSIPGDHKVEIRNLTRVLTCLRTALRLEMQMDSRILNNTYLSQYPQRLPTSEELFRGLLG